jgi:hypothetical protein
MLCLRLQEVSERLRPRGDVAGPILCLMKCGEAACDRPWATEPRPRPRSFALPTNEQSSRCLRRRLRSCACTLRSFRLAMQNPFAINRRRILELMNTTTRSFQSRAHNNPFSQSRALAGGVLRVLNHSVTQRWYRLHRCTTIPHLKRHTLVPCALGPSEDTFRPPARFQVDRRLI